MVCCVICLDLETSQTEKIETAISCREYRVDLIEETLSGKMYEP